MLAERLLRADPSDAGNHHRLYQAAVTISGSSCDALQINGWKRQPQHAEDFVGQCRNIPGGPACRLLYKWRLARVGHGLESRPLNQLDTEHRQVCLYELQPGMVGHALAQHW